jgi:hypothetical protein
MELVLRSGPYFSYIHSLTSNQSDFISLIPYLNSSLLVMPNSLLSFRASQKPYVTRESQRADFAFSNFSDLAKQT